MKKTSRFILVYPSCPFSMAVTVCTPLQTLQPACVRKARAKEKFALHAHSQCVRQISEPYPNGGHINKSLKSATDVQDVPAKTNVHPGIQN